MSQLEYKCPCCAGQLYFDSHLQELKCPYCDSQFTAESLRDYDASLAQEKPDSFEWGTKGRQQFSEQDEEAVQLFTCKSCGGELISDDLTAATSCPYCNNPVILMGRLSGDLKPDKVIPFRYNREQAKAAYKKFLKGKLLAPRSFSTEAHISELKAIYVPYWLYDSEVDAQMRYRGSIQSSYADSKYVYHKTDYYTLIREGQMSFEHLPVDASKKMDDALMEAIEPFDYSEAKDFQTAYLAGYLAERYDVDEQTSQARARERLYQSVEEAFKASTMGYGAVVREHRSVQVTEGKKEYALYPVWLMNTVWRGKTYTFAMNGQTGRFIGDLPLEKKRFFGLWFGLSALISPVLYALAYFYLT